MFGMVTELPVPSWKRTRQPAVARPRLSRDVIVEAALVLLDREGLDGVSMRRVADDLKTGAASLYAHVANKEELLDLLLDRVVDEIEVPAPDPEHWQDQVRAVGRRMYEVYTSHRDIARVAIANIPTGPNALRIAEALFAILLAGGLPPKVAGWTLDRLTLYVCADVYEGSIYRYRQEASGLSADEYVECYFGGIHDFYESLPTDRFPNVTTHLAEMFGGDGRDRFEFGLDMIVCGLETYVTAPAHSGQVPKTSTV